MTTLYDIHVKRRFTGGILEGLEIDQIISRMPEKPKIGSTHEVKKPFGSSPYIDTVVEVIPFKFDIPT